MTSDLSTLLPGYAVERELGRGAMGVVHLARHEKLGRHVAVKELQATLAADPAIRSRFLVEAEAMASFDHPHIVPVYDFVERDDRCALVMEQLPGGTVWDRFVDLGVTMPQAVAITLATCSAMHHAHGRGILHRDIKPENLMFDGTGGMKVTDFGIARMVNGASTKATIAGSVLGTPAYMAPEQAEGKAVDESADVYATATMLYELLSGRLPFATTDSLAALLTQRIMHDPIELTDVAPHVPAPIARTAMRALARSANSRTSTAEEFGVELATAASAAWGSAWLDAVDVDVLGSPAIARAARSGHAPQRDIAGDPRATVIPDSATPSTAPPASATVGADSLADRDDTPDEFAPDPSPEPPTDPGPHAPASVDVAQVEVVRPKPTDRDVGRAQADEIDELIDISQVLAPPSRPIAQYIAAATLLLVGLAWAFLGGGSNDDAAPPSLQSISIAGSPVGDDPIEVDLNEPFSLTGLDNDQPASITFEQFGIPVGSADGTLSLDGSHEFDPEFLGRITSGAMQARIESGTDPAQRVVDITGTNPWFLSATGIVSVLVFLFAVASIESNVKSLRRGKRRTASFAGLIISGALLGASAAVGVTVILGTARNTVALVGPTALCAAGALALGVAVTASRARRRAAKQIVRREAIKALASR